MTAAVVSTSLTGPASPEIPNLAITQALASSSRSLAHNHSVALSKNFLDGAPSMPHPKRAGDLIDMLPAPLPHPISDRSPEVSDRDASPDRVLSLRRFVSL